VSPGDALFDYELFDEDFRQSADGMPDDELFNGCPTGCPTRYSTTSFSAEFPTGRPALYFQRL
jgi:hypothetical protein